MTVEELKKYLPTDIEDEVLAAKLSALELSIRRYTNNNFQKRAVRVMADVSGKEIIVDAAVPFKVGDTVQISHSDLNEGLYTVNEVKNAAFTVNEEVTEEKDIICTLIEYPTDVKLGAVNILKWQLKNEAAANGDKSAMPIQSESISRHSVTYAQDSTESDLSEDFGVPKKYIAFLNSYRKARF